MIIVPKAAWRCEMKPEIFDDMIFHRSALSVFKRIAPTSSLCSSRLWVFCCSGWWPVGLVVRPTPACRAASDAAAMPKAKEEAKEACSGIACCAMPGCPYLAHSDPRMFNLCCLRCFEYNWRLVGKKRHGYCCEGIPGATEAKRAEYIGDPPPMFNYENQRPEWLPKAEECSCSGLIWIAGKNLLRIRACVVIVGVVALAICLHSLLFL